MSSISPVRHKLFTEACSRTRHTPMAKREPYRGPLPTLGAGGGGGGAERTLGAGRGLLAAGAEPIGAPPDRDGRDPAPPSRPALPHVAMEGVGVERTRSITVPRAWTCCEAFDRLATCPRGMPNPAELLRMITRLPAVVVDPRPRCTTSVRVPVVGAFGALKPLGGFSTRGVVYQPVQAPPGCHAQPYPGRKTHVP